MNEQVRPNVSQTDTSSQEAGERGANVRIEITEGVAKWLLVFLVCVCLLSLMLSVVAVVNSFEIAPRQVARASEAVDRASDRLENNTRYLIQIQYWAQLVYAQGQAQGFKIPKPPEHRE